MTAIGASGLGRQWLHSSMVLLYRAFCSCTLQSAPLLGLCFPLCWTQKMVVACKCRICILSGWQVEDIRRRESPMLLKWQCSKSCNSDLISHWNSSLIDIFKWTSFSKVSYLVAVKRIVKIRYEGT